MTWHANEQVVRREVVASHCTSQTGEGTGPVGLMKREKRNKSFLAQLRCCGPSLG